MEELKKQMKPVAKPTGTTPEPAPTPPGLEPSPAPGTPPAPATSPAGATGKGKTEPETVDDPTKPFIAYNPQMGLGEFGYGLSGAEWYPMTILGDIFEAKMTFHIPAGLELTANGAMLKRDVGRSGIGGIGMKAGEFVFETKRPVFGLYFAYGKYQMQEFTLGKIKYYTYLRPANAAKAEAYAKTASSILNFYGDRFGAFPFEKLAIVETPLPPFLGGVGPASMMILHEGMVAQKDVPSTLLAHELAHQWFGNLIPISLMIEPGYNQWLSEGFATYADAMYTEQMDGKEALGRHMQRYGQLYFQYSLMFPRRMPSVKDCLPGSALYRPVVYEKGAIVLHALRKVMGDAKFFELMKRYVEKYQDKATTIDDFRHMANEVKGDDLSWFFSQWMDQTVFAHWVIQNVTIKEETAGGKFKVTVDLKQPDDLVKMPADISVLGDAGQRLMVENILIDKIEQKIEFETPFKPARIIIDEYNWTLKHPGTDNEWPAEKK